MIVYRFERNGIGPYVSSVRMTVGSFFGASTNTRTSKKYHSVFTQELAKSGVDRYDAWVIAHQKKSYMFGCSSKEQLRAYFRGNFKTLFKQGFRIKRYQVPDDEVIDMVVEVAFPVKYHKLQTMQNVRKRLTVRT